MIMTTFVDIYKHLGECEMCPKSNKDALVSLRKDVRDKVAHVCYVVPATSTLTTTSVLNTLSRNDAGLPVVVPALASRSLPLRHNPYYSLNMAALQF